MTVTYTAHVTSCKRFGCFWKLLFRWKGSIYKLLWPNLMVYVMLYTTLSFAYRFLLDDKSRTTFEMFSLHCQTYSDLIPVSFVLGFYVSIVIKRWWDQYLTIPWPDALAVYVSTFIAGQDDRARLMRRTIMRYANLSLLLTFRMMCPTVKKRFPTLDHLMEAGFLLPNEKKIFDGLDMKTPHPKYWLPLVWATAVIRRARREGKVPDDFALKTLIDEVVKFRGGCGGLLSFDWISIPLVYTQVVTLAVYSYFAATLMGNQYLDPKKGYPKHPIDLVVPIFTFLQFFFYMGWLLVAETLVNPFGEDDDDFEVNWLIDRNLQISYVIVDEMHEEHPELIKDQYWDQVFPSELPYTEAAKQYYMEPFLGSAFGVAVPENMQTFVLMSGEEGRLQTTPVIIKGASHKIGDSLARFPSFMGSFHSLNKKKWKSFLKPTGSQPFSINSAYKFQDDDYPDDVFSISGISVGSSKMLAQKMSTEKEVHGNVKKKRRRSILVEETPIHDLSRTASSVTMSGGPSGYVDVSTKEMDTENLKSETLDYSYEEKDSEAILDETKGAMQLWDGPTDDSSYKILPLNPSLQEHHIPIVDLKFIEKATQLKLLGEYKHFEQESSLLKPKSEAIDVPCKPCQFSQDSQKPNYSENNYDSEEDYYVG